MSEAPHTRRRSFQFGIGTMLAVVTLVALAVGTFAWARQSTGMTAVLVTALFVAAFYLLAFVPSFIARHLSRREGTSVASMERKSKRQLLVRWLVAACAVLTIVFVGRRLLDDRICAFHFSHDRSIVLRYSSFMAELECPVTYEVYVGSKVVSPAWGCSGAPIPFDQTDANFRAFEFPDEKVVVQHRPNDPSYGWKTIVAHDFRTGQSWPRDRGIPEMKADIAEGSPVTPQNLLH